MKETTKEIPINPQSTVTIRGQSLGTIIPKIITTQTKIEAGDTLHWAIKEGKHGTYIAFWKR